MLPQIRQGPHKGLRGGWRLHQVRVDGEEGPKEEEEEDASYIACVSPPGARLKVSPPLKINHKN